MTRKDLFDLAGVVSHGIGFKITNGKKTSEICVIVGVEVKKPLSELKAADVIPKSIGGMNTDVIETGKVGIFADPTKKFRPVVGGISIGHKDITAGTLGCFVTKDGKILALSNNHVLANSNKGQIGDAICQPGPYDGGEQCGTLHSFKEIGFVGASDCKIANAFVRLLNGLAEMVGSRSRVRAIRDLTNTCDCALCEMLPDVGIANTILEIGTPTGSAEVTLGTPIKKFGRTTLFTQGTVDQIDATIQVSYGETEVAIFTGQIIAGPMSAGGDSGSAVLDGDNAVIGLLFAGSDTVTVINPIKDVMAALGCEIWTR